MVGSLALLCLVSGFYLLVSFLPFIYVVSCVIRFLSHVLPLAQEELFSFDPMFYFMS